VIQRSQVSSPILQPRSPPNNNAGELIQVIEVFMWVSVTTPPTDLDPMCVCVCDRSHSMIMLMPTPTTNVHHHHQPTGGGGPTPDPTTNPNPDQGQGQVTYLVGSAWVDVIVGACVLGPPRCRRRRSVWCVWGETHPPSHPPFQTGTGWNSSNNRGRRNQDAKR